MVYDLRRHQRVTLPRTFVMKIPGKKTQYSRIENISEGGICFDCNFDLCLQKNQTLHIDLYCCDDGSLLEKLPIEVLSTYEHAPENMQMPVPKLVTGARFLDLNEKQKRVLYRYIKYQAM
nr:PilZ domain-containing protein [Desulfogranum japonicum]